MSLFEENAAILRKMESDGSDLGLPRVIDFSHVFPDRTSANAFAGEVEKEGYATAVEEVEREEYRWDVTASKQMAPTCGNITNTEERLDALARSYQGRADGWGFFRL
ncbi:ribonuclease E inhibitor RraB [Agrobacterium rhizogenes]|uniref:ribonuclease E inhibitor RraB n=1 Tax=Rhizobium rhizogenes TaxID=359 RepID=UPI0015730AF7|nr:ribonuclease E inhibitor RraB [Rhizobium rhizogenes]NTG50040.1 ribonuclease E inhibitor RraB [Rhizobium rhizogenes]